MTHRNTAPRSSSSRLVSTLFLRSIHSVQVAVVKESGNICCVRHRQSRIEHVIASACDTTYCFLAFIVFSLGHVNDTVLSGHVNDTVLSVFTDQRD